MKFDWKEFLDELKNKEKEPKNFEEYLQKKYIKQNIEDPLWGLELKYFAAKYCRKDEDETKEAELAIENFHKGILPKWAQKPPKKAPSASQRLSITEPKKEAMARNPRKKINEETSPTKNIAIKVSDSNPSCGVNLDEEISGFED